MGILPMKCVSRAPSPCPRAEARATPAHFAVSESSAFAEVRDRPGRPGQRGALPHLCKGGAFAYDRLRPAYQ
jgi:hypothetical protein